MNISRKRINDTVNLLSNLLVKLAKYITVLQYTSFKQEIVEQKKPNDYQSDVRVTHLVFHLFFGLLIV